MRALIGSLVVLVTLAGCSLTKKKIAPKHTYRAGFLASTDGRRFRTLLEILGDAEKAKPFCRSLNREFQTKAQYTVERKDSGITLKIKECESPAQDNCRKLDKCLHTRPVAWLTRSSGRTPGHSGVITTDWLGRCGGIVAVNFYHGPQSPQPLERAGCAEPRHDAIDTAHEMFFVPRLDAEALPAAIPAIEALLRRWNELVFSEVDPLRK